MSTQVQKNIGKVKRIYNQTSVQKISVTAETINNEYNKEILFSLIKSKVSKIPGVSNLDHNYL